MEPAIPRSPYRIDEQLNSLQEHLNVYWHGMCGNIYLSVFKNSLFVVSHAAFHPFYNPEDLKVFCLRRRCICAHDCFNHPLFVVEIEKIKRYYLKKEYRTVTEIY